MTRHGTGRAGAPAPEADPRVDATVYTDGGASPNPGPGGWAAVILRPGAAAEELSGGEDRTTNNRMELTAAIRALEALDPGDRVRLYTDSQYLRQGVTRWLAGWIARGWKRSGGGAVENEDLWRRLHAVTGGRAVEWSWIRGHAGNHWNERADELASAEIRRHKKQRAAAAPSPAEAADYEVCLRVSAGGGKGGWAALVRGGGEERQKSGARRGASANQMDVAAAAELLESLPAGARIAFHTASDYLRNGARSWLPAWRSRGWKTKDGRPVANRELWERLARVLAERDVVWPAAEHAPPELAALEPAARDARRGA